MPKLFTFTDMNNQDPLSQIVDYLVSLDKDKVVNDLLDVFAETAVTLEQYNQLAKLYMDNKNIDKAELFAVKVLNGVTTEPDKYSARANLAKLYNIQNKPAESLQLSEINHKLNPHCIDTMLEISFSLYLLNRKSEAEALLRSLKSRQHLLSARQKTVVDFNLGTYDLARGDFIEGLKGFMLNGRDLGLWAKSSLPKPFTFWDGTVKTNDKIIVYADGGGIGDEMMCVRFVNKLKDKGFDPVYYTLREDLANIFNRCGIPTVTNLEKMPHDAMWTYYMQVPIYLNSSPDEIMASNYLWASDTAKSKWSHMKDSNKMKIGVRWCGNSKNERELHRKVDIHAILKMLDTVYGLNNVELYSLQIGDGEEEAEKIPELIKIANDVASYDDTLAVLENLDLVITSCTSVLHASAIVGTKTMGLIPICSYFPWVSPAPAHSSIWYADNLKLFHQEIPNSWDEPLTQLEEYLRK